MHFRNPLSRRLFIALFISSNKMKIASSGDIKAAGLKYETYNGLFIINFKQDCFVNLFIINLFFISE